VGTDWAGSSSSSLETEETNPQGSLICLANFSALVAIFFKGQAKGDREMDA
jgi:hypothetical protein